MGTEELRESIPDRVRSVEVSGGEEQLESMIARIHEIGPLLRENAVVADRDRRVPQVSIEAIHDTGAFAIATPTAYGGHDEGTRWLFEAARTIGTYCPASSWCVVISNGSVMLSNRYPKAARDTFHAGGVPVRMASVLVAIRADAVREGDGYRVTGEWGFASNILNSEWALVVLPARESADAEPSPSVLMLHKSEYTVHDTWRTIGMRGTGSNTIQVDNLWVPEVRLIDAQTILGNGYESRMDTFYSQRLPPRPTMAITIIAPSLGASQAALDFVAEKGRERPVTYSTYARQVESGAWVKDLGHAAAKIDGALLNLRRGADVVDAIAEGYDPMPDDLRATIRGNIGSATHSIADAMNDLAWLHGTATFADSNTLGRLWRDANTGLRHAAIAAPMNFEVRGDGLLGLPFASHRV